jgi:hypothetical protein
VLADVNTFNVNSTASDYTVTIQDQATVTWTADAEVHFLRAGTGDIVVEAATGVLLNGVDGGSVTMTVQNGAASLKRIDEDEWWLGGLVEDPVDFTIIYPNGGSEGSPANISINTRYVESNPFPGFYVLCVVEILFSGVWVTTGWYATSGSAAIGVAAAQIGGTDIIVRTGVSGLITGAQISGSNANYTSTSTYSTPTPCRVKVWRVKGSTA